MSRKGKERPGLVKVKLEPLLSWRTLPLVKSSDYRLRQLFESADVVSEGKVRDEPEGAVYYGSTSILLRFTSKGGQVPDNQAEPMLALLSIDPHARLRAVRISCLEAQIRARAPIGRVRTELFVRRDVHGLRIDVEVEAAVFDESLSTKPSSTTPARRRRSSQS